MKTKKGNRRTEFTPVAVVGARLLLFCAMVVIPGPGSSSTAAGPEPLYYHYFKERRPLKLQTERVAILASTPAPQGVAQALYRFGLIPDGTQELPIAGWSLVGTPAASRTGSAIQELLSSMSGDSTFSFVAPVIAGDDGGPNIVTPDLLVRFEASVTEQSAEAILAELNAGDIIQRRFGNMPGAYHLWTRLKNGFDVLDLANKLAERPEVRFAEPDMIFTGKGDLIPNDPGFTNLWAMKNTAQFGGTLGLDMKGPQAWDITTGSSNIIVVIIDVGVQTNHPDINQIPGTNFTSDVSFDGGPVNACDNHGTAVAGCVSAKINNALGTVGIAPGCRCASARAFISLNMCDNHWTTASSWTVNALAWAQSIGARVSNNSNNYGLAVQSSAIADAYAFTRAMGMVHFASAGNDTNTVITYPASLPGVNAVAALGEGGALASFSNHGTGLAFSAPGQDIYTTDRTGANGYGTNDYVFSNGTSLASPYAAGVAALVLSVNPSLSATNVEQIMQQSAVDLGTPGYDTTYGWGLVNAYNAVTLALALPAHTIFVTNTADSGPGTLRAALGSAANGDTIDASGVSGTILLTSGALLVSNSVTILGPGPANLAVNGNGASHVFNISGTVVTISGLTITNGNASGGYPANAGGGIYTGPGTLTVSNCAFNRNSAQYGGAILGDHSILTVSACTFIGNSAQYGGGGIFNNAVFGDATLSITNCSFSGNSASDAGGWGGGAIYNNGQVSGSATAQLANSTFSGNLGPYGAGIFNDGNSGGSASLTVSSCTLSNNSASSVGGGIFNHGYSGSATLTVSASTISGNSANGGNGGGIFNHGYSGNGTLSVSASIVSSNTASGSGGGIFNNGYSGNATLTVSNCTLSGNRANNDSGGAIYNNGQVSGNGTAQIANSTLSGNLAGYGAGIYNDGHSGGRAALTVIASSLSGNSASGWGGGILNNGTSSGTGTVQVLTSTLRTNSAQFGGSIFNSGESSGNASLLVSASTLSSNSANNDGGSIYNDGYAGSATLTVSNSTLSGNSAGGAGAGIYNNGKSSGTGSVQIATSTLSGNLASGDGGGVYNDGTSSGKATLTVKAGTLSGNSAGGGNGGAIRNNGSGGSASVELGSTILKAGASGGNLANLSAAVSSDGYNLSSDSAGGLLTSLTDQVNTDPMLGPLQDNGGPTFTHALLPGSPAIDKGKNFNGLATDQRGLPRTMDSLCIANALGGDGTDIGAFEVQELCLVAVSIGSVGVVLNQLGFDITGGSNRVVVVEASTNLVNWTALTTNTLGVTPLHFVDPDWANFPQRFYRINLIP
jgi:subtilisin family serine protease